MHLSKTKYCNAIQCKKMLWLLENHLEEASELNHDAVLDNGTEVGELARELFGKHINISYCDDKSKMIYDTKKALECETGVVTEASFSYDNNFCSVDILIKNKDSYEIVEVKSSTEVHDIYLHDVAYQYYVLTKLGYSVTKASIAYLNKNYIRKGKLELDKLFLFEDVTTYAEEHLEEVEKNISEIKNYAITSSDDIGMHCFKPYECPFFAYCTKKLPEQNVFQIRKMSNKKKIELYHKHCYSYQDVLCTPINANQKQQIEFELFNQEPYINYENIRSFLNNLSYPLYFLDFETYQQSVPLYDGISPYMQVPFQYSLHYIESEGSFLQHKEFLADGISDPRRKLAECLIRDIPNHACVLAYNMMFEKMVIRNLAYQFKDLREALMKIHDNIQDLMIPFLHRDYYTKEMQGSYSIKYVLPALFPDEPAFDYHNLELIHNGSEASSSYATLAELSESDQRKVRACLLKYCELDTLAMVKIWEKLQEAVLEKV